MARSSARYLLALLLALLAPVLGVGSASAQGPDGPWFEASLAAPWVVGCQFAGDVEVVVTDEDGQLLWRATGQLKPDGCFEVNPSPPLSPGMGVRVTDGSTTRTLTLVELSIKGVNPETDTAWGSAPPNTDLHVDSDLGTTWADTYPRADATGQWTADFADIGADLVPGNDLGADIWDGYAATVYDVAVPPDVDDLAALVNDLVPPRWSGALTRKLTVVKQTLQQDRVSVGITLLESYVYQVQGLARSGKISADTSEQLVGSANDLISGLGG